MRFNDKSKGKEIPVDPVAEKREIWNFAILNYWI